ncbi:MAG: maleylpyruvate isomerase family mycothiol-dependent enzyme [Actinomycetota bacterium]
MTLSTDTYLDHTRTGGAAFADALIGADVDAPVVACGDWTVADLVGHIGTVHRWAAVALREGRQPGRDDLADAPPFDPSDASGWYRACLDDIVAELEAADPVASSWHPFPVEQVAGFWFRRMAHEIAVHRWDLEHAVSTPTTMDPALASDGIDEYFEVTIPRLVVQGRDLPTSSFHVHCTDVEGEWLVWTEDGDYRMVREHRKGDAALRGPAEQLLLRMWNRPAPDDELSPVGDETAFVDWTSLGGN